MILEKLNSMLARTFFFGSFLLLTVAGLEKVANLFGYTFEEKLHYTPGRLLEWAGILLLFVLALLLRQVRDEVKKLKIE